jgi:hypothetical protein
VKLVKKVRVGSKVRRAYDAAQAKPERVAELKKLRQSLDPFQLGKLIDQKLQRIYDLANRRLSPKVAAENRAAHAKEKNTTRPALNAYVTRHGVGRNEGLESVSRRGPRCRAHP